MKKPEIIEVAPLREQIADIVRQMIINGDLESEQKISERQIGTMLNVSTTPVKEAFRTLQAEGLIYSIPRKGSFVSAHSKDNLMQYSLVRSALDGVAANLAAQFADEGDIAYMQNELSIARQLIQEHGDSAEISKHNYNYHVRLREATKNNFLVNLTTMVASMDNSIRQVVNKTDFDELMMRQEEHENILQMIIEKKSEEAEQLMIVHIRKATKKALRKE
ncbi:MAG: GntR family transcriptional regulator [Eubacteriales bacterium]|nr:GntR family transcriptional regulator [Eubacteriales bacterium]